MTRDIKAVLAGIVVFATLSLVSFLFLTWAKDVDGLSFLRWPMGALVFAGPLVSGGVCGYLAQEGHQFIALVILGIVEAVAFGVLPNEVGGPNDLPIVIGLAMLPFVALVAIGGAFGSMLQRGPPYL